MLGASRLSSPQFGTCVHHDGVIIMDGDLLKPLDKICEPDSRQGAFVRLDLPSGRFHSQSLVEHYTDLAALALPDHVPEDIRHQFDTARNFCSTPGMSGVFVRSLSSTLTPLSNSHLGSGHCKRSAASPILPRGWRGFSNSQSRKAGSVSRNSPSTEPLMPTRRSHSSVGYEFSVKSILPLIGPHKSTRQDMQQ